MDFDNFDESFNEPEIDKYRDFILSQNNCTLCGSQLEVSHKTNETLGTIKEEAQCPSCEVRIRARTYTVN